MLAKGRFDQVRIEGLIREQGGVVEDYKGSRLLVQDEKKLAVVFVEPGLVAIGAPAAVRKSIDTKESGTDVTDNDEVMRLVRDIDDGDAWVVARFDALAGARTARPRWQTSCRRSTGSRRRDSSTAASQGQLRVETRDEPSAQNLQEVIRGFMALGRLQSGQHPEFAEFLNSIQLGRRRKDRLPVVFAAVRDDRCARGASCSARQAEVHAGRPATGRPSGAVGRSNR